MEGATMVTREEITAAAKRRGLSIDTEWSGPFFKITARRIATRVDLDGNELESGEMVGRCRLSSA